MESYFSQKVNDADCSQNFTATVEDIIDTQRSNSFQKVKNSRLDLIKLINTQREISYQRGKQNGTHISGLCDLRGMGERLGGQEYNKILGDTKSNVISGGENELGYDLRQMLNSLRSFNDDMEKREENGDFDETDSSNDDLHGGISEEDLVEEELELTEIEETSNFGFPENPIFKF